MRRVLGVVVILVGLSSAPALAQQLDDSAPSVNLGYVGINTGVTVVEKSGGVIGVDAGARVWRNLDGIVDFFWSSNAVTRRQLDNVDRLAGVLGAQGDASGSMKVPVTYVGVGGRWVFENSGRYRPYVLGTLGAARTNRKATFSLDGSDVTGNIGAYGITLGKDLAGSHSHFGAEAGVGFVTGMGDWYVDVGARLLSIGASDERINVARLVFGGGYRF
jgi:hypothetical protein